MGIRLKGQTSGYVEIKAPATSADNTLTLPNGNGSSNQVLTTDGSGGLTFAAPQLSTDTTPQLGGDLDVNGNDIVTTSNGDIDLDPNGSGQVVFKGNATRGSGAVKLNCENNSHGILVKGPPHSAGANYTLTLPNDTGTSGQLLSTNGSGVTSWASVGGPTFQATASGAIANGDTCIVKSDGNVAAVSKTVTSKTVANFVITSIADITSESAFSFRSVYAAGSSAVLVTYRHNTSDEQFVRAVFTSGTTVTYSSTRSLGSSIGEFSSMVYDENADRVVVFYRQSGGSLTCRVITINGTNAPSMGAEVTVDSGVVEENFDTSYDANAGKIVVVFRESTNNKPVIRVGTVDVDNATVSFGTAVNAVTTTGKHNSIVYDANSQKHVHVYTNSSNDFEAKVFTVSGTSGSYGSATTITTSNPHSTKGVFDSAQNKVFFAFRDDSIGDAGKCVAGNVSGTSVTFGSVVNIDDVDITTLDVDFDTDVQKVVIGYGEKITNNLEVTRANISGTTVTIDTNKDTAAQTGAVGIGVTYDKSAEKLVLTFRDPGNGYGGTRLVAMADTSTNLTATNYIGIADAAYSNGATATIQIIGAVDDAQSGLTPGLQYYVQTNGSLGTGAGTPSVFAGTAVSATKLIVKG